MNNRRGKIIISGVLGIATATLTSGYLILYNQKYQKLSSDDPALCSTLLFSCSSAIGALTQFTSCKILNSTSTENLMSALFSGGERLRNADENQESTRIHNLRPDNLPNNSRADLVIGNSNSQQILF